MLTILPLIDWHRDGLYFLGAFLLAYLLGSIPFGLIFSHLAGAGDVRKIGSGNIGATNVLRTGKRWAAAATLLCDGGKGAAAVLIARHYGGDLFATIAGLGAFFGHVFPVWLRFKGGKGVATFLGIALALAWPVGVLACITWLMIAALFRISSLAALWSAAATPVYFAIWGTWLYALLAFVLAVLIFVTHRANIMRLIRGEEPRIGAKKKEI
jgi:glycerol-3-phosphate acyltransferase PlsY